MTHATLTAHALRTSLKMLEMFCKDISPDDMLHRAVAGANCAAWTLGHLTLSARSMAKRLGAPESAMPTLPEGFERRYVRSDNAPQACDFGDTSVLLPVLRENTELLAITIEKLTDEQINTPLPENMANPMFQTLGELAAFAAVHNASHAGQISTIRRSLGRPPIV